ncbi:hypothetical protein [Mariniphaga sp.]|uniref:hypothetical protein n=1 Tax=Mariniphaga sp. TaxID=1954475 RepID=UPI003563B189
MNQHIFFDNLTATIGALATGKKKFFSQSLKSQGFSALINNTEIHLSGKFQEGTYELEAETPVGILDPAFKVVKWHGNNFPTIIYHHGNNERPFDFRKSAKNTFFQIFVNSPEEIKANLIVVRAPFHNSSIKAYQEKMTDLQNFATMIATSVKLNEAIISELSSKGCDKILTSGISLGGWVTNLHRSYFNTSTVYIPLMAGTFLGELFIRSKYKKLTSENALKNAEALKNVLNFDEAFKKVNSPNVFPLLGRYDQFIEYQVQKESYTGHPVKVIKNGHITGALNTKALRNHILDVLQKN